MSDRISRAALNDYIGAVVEKIFEYKGYKCVVLMQGLAFRTGYVAVPEGHKYYNVDYPDIPIECHGGLTYSRSYLIHTDDKNVWWIGFDTGHYGDGYDYESALELFKPYPKNIEGLKRKNELVHQKTYH